MDDNGYALEDQAVAMHSSFDSSIRQAKNTTINCKLLTVTKKTKKYIIRNILGSNECG